MTFYPGYTARTVLDEYASRFFVLLQRGVEIENEHKQWQLTTVSWPYLEKSTRQQINNAIDNTPQTKPDTMKIKEDRKRLREMFKRKK